MVTPSNKPDDYSWHEYRRLVVSELERLSNQLSNYKNNADSDKISHIDVIADLKEVLIRRIHEVELSTNNSILIKCEELRAKIAVLDNSVASMKAQAAIIGAVTSIVLTIAGLFVKYFIK